jgi:hypothetical protein
MTGAIVITGIITITTAISIASNRSVRPASQNGRWVYRNLQPDLQ